MFNGTTAHGVVTNNKQNLSQTTELE